MAPGYGIEFAADAQRDFGLIFDFLESSYRAFGESPEEAITHAGRRVAAIHEGASQLGEVPHRGTLHPEMMPGLRHVARDRAIYWFVVDDEARAVRVLAIFFGGQDHVRHMLARLLGRA